MNPSETATGWGSMGRRQFVKGAALAGASALSEGRALLAKDEEAQESRSEKQMKPVPTKPFGKTGEQISALAVGGYHLGSAKSASEASDIVSKSLDAGINFFDNAWEYHNGESEVRLGSALKGRRDKAFVMTKVCTHGRGKEVAMRMLEDSLRRLQTDHLDVWQIHEVVYYTDPELIFRKGGAAEALLEAKRQGKVRWIGFTGHKNPSIHMEMLSHGFPFDTVQMPLNCMDGTFRSFEQTVLPEAIRQGIAVLGMKSLGGSGEMVTRGAIMPEEGLRYAMSLPVATTISGMESLAVLEQNLEIARNFVPYTDAEMEALRQRCREFAADGRYEKFKTTMFYDGDVGRQQHGFPPAKELPL